MGEKNQQVIHFIYSYFVLPALIVFSHVLALFSKKVRKPLFQRYRILAEVQEWRNQFYDPKQHVIVIHSSSMGEFEHIKPLITRLKNTYKVSILVTFFSPSGYENVSSFPGVDKFLYLPFDYSKTWAKFYKLTAARLLIISKHDVWPNQIKVAGENNVRTILVNASLNENSSRNTFLARMMLAPVYNAMDRIFVISKQDGEQFEKSFGCRNVKVSGDTKFDQVVKRKMESARNELIKKEWLADNFILILGSLWPQDAEHVLPGMPSLLNHYDNLKIILVPHQPTGEYITLFSEYLAPYGYTLYSEDYLQADKRVLIINRIGVLADIYKYGHVAYVGGSFKQGIHNVMEPAVYGLPVIYGPFHKNSYDAKKLLKLGGSLLIHNVSEFTEQIKILVTDETKRKSIGRIAFDLVNNNSGGTDKILEYVDTIFS